MNRWHRISRYWESEPHVAPLEEWAHDAVKKIHATQRYPLEFRNLKGQTARYTPEHETDIMTEMLDFFESVVLSDGTIETSVTYREYTAYAMK